MRHLTRGLLWLSLILACCLYSAEGFSQTPSTQLIPDTHDDDSLVGSDPLDSLARYLLDKSGLVRRSEADDPWYRLNRNLAFQKFLRNRGIQSGDSTTKEERYEQLGEFLRHSLKPFSEPDFLFQRQKESLARSLFFRRDPALEPGPLQADGYQALAEISARNTERLRKLLPVAAIPDEVREITKNLSVVFIHNTHVIRSIPDSPLVSSRVLQEVSGIGGLNTYFFNRQFLRSDDNIFFFVLLQAGSKLGNARESLYGKYKFSPEEKFGRERGWVSAFVMYPYDLYRFASGFEKPLAEKLFPVFQREFPREMAAANGDQQELVKSLRPYKRDNPRWNRLLRDWFSLWRPTRRLLGNLDFNVDDFRSISLSAIESYLCGLYLDDRAEFSEWKTRLQKGDTGDLMRLAYKNRFGLDLYFEFKIPVAIPPWGLREVE